MIVLIILNLFRSCIC